MEGKQAVGIVPCADPAPASVVQRVAFPHSMSPGHLLKQLTQRTTKARKKRRFEDGVSR
jgi:hypothetical protein